MTQPVLDPAPPPGTVDWVYVGRLTGRLTGPITRAATDAELKAASAAGATATHLAELLHQNISHLHTRLGRR